MSALLRLKSSKYFLPFLTGFYLWIPCLTEIYAQESSKDWQVHGFIAQGIIDVDGSDFVNDDGSLSTELTEIGINGSYKLNDAIRLTGQMVYLDGGNRYVKGPRVDYALIDWSVYDDPKWLVNLYFGRYKNNNWLYSSTRDVPHTRPSIILPQSIYFDGFRDIAMGSDGAAVKVSYSAEELGDFDFNLSYGVSSLSQDEVKLLLGDFVQGSGKQEFDAQASLYWQPEFSPWHFGVSLLNSDFRYNRNEYDIVEDGLFSFQQYTFNTLYEGEQWEFSSEIYQQKFTIDGLYFDGFHQHKPGVGAFVQTRYKINNNLNLLARIERFYADKNDKNGTDLEESTGGLVPYYFAYQHDITLGGSYDLGERFRVQFEYHWVQGTARLTPIVFPNTEINSNEHWDMWALQLMYWF